jgi:hypothetical protein
MQNAHPLINLEYSSLNFSSNLINITHIFPQNSLPIHPLIHLIHPPSPVLPLNFAFPHFQKKNVFPIKCSSFDHPISSEQIYNNLESIPERHTTRQFYFPFPISSIGVARELASPFAPLAYIEIFIPFPILFLHLWQFEGFTAKSKKHQSILLGNNY